MKNFCYYLLAFGLALQLASPYLLDLNPKASDPIFFFSFAAIIGGVVLLWKSTEADAKKQLTFVFSILLFIAARYNSSGHEERNVEKFFHKYSDGFKVIAKGLNGAEENVYEVSTGTDSLFLRSPAYRGPKSAQIVYSFSAKELGALWDKATEIITVSNHKSSYSVWFKLAENEAFPNDFDGYDFIDSPEGLKGEPEVASTYDREYKKIENYWFVVYK